MCTVTYIPLGRDQFIFTSNRDEAPKRSATGLVKQTIEDKTLLFPKDPQANGTWIAISNHNQLVCILNGAFEKHKHEPPYRLSRGIMALNFFSYDYAEDFFDEFRFEGIEPFTMIIYDKNTLYELRWDEERTHVKRLDATKKHLWSSCTLYTSEWQDKRQQWFTNWQEQTNPITQKSVLDFHKHGGEGNSEFDIVMNYKDIVRTTSITSISKTTQQMSFRFEDLLSNKITTQKLRFP